MSVRYSVLVGVRFPGLANMRSEEHTAREGFDQSPRPTGSQQESSSSAVDLDSPRHC